MRIAFKSYDEIALLSKLKKNKWQRNKHPKEQLERLAKIMREHGVRHPIHISKRSGQVCFGHGRWEAAKLNGWTSFPVVFQDFKSDEEEFSCVQSDNAIAHWAELDLESLKDDLNSFDGLDVDLLGIRDLEISEKPIGKTDPDEVPESVPAICKTGDIWTLGNHRLMCGDSTKITDVEKLMAGEKADMVFTDPPYGMKLDADFSSIGNDKSGRGNKYNNITGDHDDFTDALISTIFTIPAKEVFIWGADYFAQLLPQRNDGSWIVWDKRVDEAFDRMIGSAFELCWSKEKHQRRIARFNYSKFGKTKDDSKSRVHPTQKPVPLIEWFFNNWGDRLVSVLDLFGGSGSTLIACEKTNRKCYMMEIDPHYCDVIIKRWENFTGLKAKKVDGKRKPAEKKEKAIRRKKAR